MLNPHALNPRIEKGAPVIVQGITGRQGQRHARLMRAYGTNVVGGVSPKSSTEMVDDMPVFKTCADAVAATGAVATVVLVRPDLAADAIIEAAQAGISTVVCVAEGIPVHDALRAYRVTRDLGTFWVGASTPGMAIPSIGLKLGFLPNVALLPGSIGMMSKSGTLSYEAGYRLAGRGIGQSVWVGVGGDPVKGTRFADLVPFYKQDDETRALVIVGEIGGDEEESLAAAITAENFTKPVFAVIAGSSAPEGVTMGHAGALVYGTLGSAASKRQALEAAGARVFSTIEGLVDAVSDL
jgi:succinyl-CoA synthetase alpha subunit